MTSMTRRRVDWLPLTLLVLATSLLLMTGLITDWWAGKTLDEAIGGFMLLLTALGYMATGGLVATRIPGHRVGWVFILTGLSLLSAGATQAMADAGIIVGYAVGGGFFFSFILLAGFLLLWFPTGRVLGPRWRWVERVGYAGIAYSLIGHTFTAEVCIDAGFGAACNEFARNPIGISWMPNPEYGPFANIVGSMLLGFTLAGATSVVVRFARSKGIERKQLTWLVFTVATLIAYVVMIEVFLPTVVPTGVQDFLFGLLNLAIPVAGATAILRYRLYEIDRIVSRTLGYSVVIGVFALTYAAGAVWLPSKLVGEATPPLFVAASTLAIAALFNPVRRRVLGWVDRRFYRSRFNADHVAAEFSIRLRDALEEGALTTEFATAVHGTVQPSLARLWVRSA